MAMKEISGRVGIVRGVAGAVVAVPDLKVGKVDRHPLLPFRVFPLFHLTTQETGGVRGKRGR